MARQPDALTLHGLSRALAALAGRMGKQDAAEALGAASAAVPRTRTAPQLVGLCAALAALAGQLGREEVAGLLGPTAHTLVERLATEKDINAGRPLTEALSGLAAWMSEGELVGLLRDPLCSGRAQSAVLGELGRRCGQPFPDVWQFVAWAGANRPTLDLRTAPAEPR